MAAEGEKCKDVLSRLTKRNAQLYQHLDLTEALQMLQSFWTHHHFLPLSFETFQRKLPSHLSTCTLTLYIGPNKSATSDTNEILRDICCIVESALIHDALLHITAIQLCRNTFPLQSTQNPLLFTSNKRLQCMRYIAQNEFSGDTLKDDLEDINESAIIDVLNLDSDEEKTQWTTHLQRALDEATVITEKLSSDQSSNPSLNDAQSGHSDEDDMKYITPTCTISDPSLNKPYLIPYSLDDCKRIVAALLNVIMLNPVDLDSDAASSPTSSSTRSTSPTSVSPSSSSTKQNARNRFKDFKQRLRRKKKAKSDPQQQPHSEAYEPMDYQLIMGQLKDVLVELSHECSFNVCPYALSLHLLLIHVISVRAFNEIYIQQLLRICDLIARYQLKHFLKYSRTDSKLVDLMQDFLVNKGRIKIENIEVFTEQGVLFTRMLPFRPFIARLATYPTLSESPKLLQVLLALMCYRGEQNIINVYREEIDYERKHAVCIDTIAVYLPKMMDIIASKLYRLRRRGKLELIDIPQKHCMDPEYNKTDAIYKRVFGGIPELIRKFGKERKNEKNAYLLRMFVLLAKDENQGPLYEYPRTIVSIQCLDEKIRHRIGQRVYAKLTDIKQPVHVYQVLLAKKRHQCDMHMLQQELMRCLQYSDEDGMDEYAVNTLLATHYSMFATIVYPQRYKDENLVFTKKAYHLYANSIMRFQAEKDILSVLPRYFAHNQLTNVLQETQMQQIASYRRATKDKYSRDVEFKEYQSQFFEYKKSRK